jgi:hypothetical protein
MRSAGGCSSKWCACCNLHLILNYKYLWLLAANRLGKQAF